MLLAAGCGGEEPGIPEGVATQLAAQSDQAAAALESQAFCDARGHAARLQEGTIAAINSGRIPAELQEDLLASANALLESITCIPPRAGDGTLDEARDLAEWLRDRAVSQPGS